MYLPFEPEESYSAGFTASTGTSCYLTVYDTLQCGKLVWSCVVLHLEPLHIKERQISLPAMTQYYTYM